MADNHIQTLRCALRLFLMLMVITGLLYPLSITLVAQVLFPWSANGSMIEKNGVMIGSQLIGQSFTSVDYFWGRPSATTPTPYAMVSNASHLSPSNPQLLNLIQTRIAAWQLADKETHALLPIDLVTASASGLDPDITPEAAYYQVYRVAKARRLLTDQLMQLVTQQIQPSLLGWWGEPRVNVLLLNLALDELSHNERKS